MNEFPAWLPEMVFTNGEWEKVVARLYAIFEQDFKQSSPKFKNMPVWWDRRILEGDKYEEGFWHLITRIDKKTKERLFDPRRAERLTWCGPTINNACDDEVTLWDYKEARGRVRTYLWLEQCDYSIILEKRQVKRVGEVAFLVTAFYVDGPSARKNLQRKYAKRLS